MKWLGLQIKKMSFALTFSTLGSLYLQVEFLRSVSYGFCCLCNRSAGGIRDGFACMKQTEEWLTRKVLCWKGSWGWGVSNTAGGKKTSTLGGINRSSQLPFYILPPFIYHRLECISNAVSSSEPTNAKQMLINFTYVSWEPPSSSRTCPMKRGWGSWAYSTQRRDGLGTPRQQLLVCKVIIKMELSFREIYGKRMAGNLYINIEIFLDIRMKSTTIKIMKHWNLPAVKKWCVVHPSHQTSFSISSP